MTTIASHPNHYAPLQQPITTLQDKYSELYEEITDQLHFFIEFFKDPLANGSIIPSSKYLAREVTKYIGVNSNSEPRTYLEVGPGTGPFTIEIIKHLRPIDRLDIVELNSSYCEKLKKKFIQHKNVHIHCLSITDWHPSYQYNAIVSGLPLNAFSPDLVKKIFHVFTSITKKNGTISYFEYPNIASFFAYVYTGEKEKKLNKIFEIKRKIFQSYGIEQKIIKKNIPTANAIHLKLERLYYGNSKTQTISTVPNPA